MSIISSQSGDKSNFLCKRFASLTSSYFEHPAEARTATARVPLENLFRVLEMYRNDTFSDESRKGVLALERRDSLPMSLTRDDSWHVQIKDAVHRSIVAAFGQNVSETDATQELQSALRWLAADGDLPNSDVVVPRAKNFFAELSVAL